MDTLHDGIVCAIHLGATLIADEYHLATTVLQLLQVRCHVPYIYDASKCHEVVHHRLLSKPRLEWGHGIHALRQTPVQHIYNNTHRFALELVGKALDLEHAPGSFHHRVIPALDDIVLLRVVEHCVLMMHALGHAVLHELPHGETASTVSTEHPQLQAGFAFRTHLDLLDSSHYTILGGDGGYPHVHVEVIHEQ
jgi:hypothetical protein